MRRGVIIRPVIRKGRSLTGTEETGFTRTRLECQSSPQELSRTGLSPELAGSVSEILSVGLAVLSASDPHCMTTWGALPVPVNAARRIRKAFVIEDPHSGKSSSSQPSSKASTTWVSPTHVSIHQSQRVTWPRVPLFRKVQICFSLIRTVDEFLCSEKAASLGKYHNSPL